MVFKFDIDSILDKYIPPNQLHKLPKFMARFLGYHHPSPKSDLLIWLEIFISTFCGVSLIQLVFKSHTVFSKHHVPVMLASYGATSILCFNAVKSPLGQPRNLFIGHFLGAFIGVSMQKLFLLTQDGRDNYWASGSLSVAVASVCMSILNCVHPPAGASAILPSIDSGIREMGWWFLPTQVVGSILIIGVALICTNIIRKYPQYWWSPGILEAVLIDNEQMMENINVNNFNQSEVKESIKFMSKGHIFEIYYDEVILPHNVTLDDDERDWLTSLQKTLRERREKMNS